MIGGFEWGALGESRYVRLNLQAQQYIPLGKRFTYAVNAEVGYGRGLSGRGTRSP